MAKLPGLRVGPLDPDKGENFGIVGGPGQTAQLTARRLIRFHAELNPAAQVAVFARPLDNDRSKALDMAEVRDLLAEHLPDGARVLGANVRGDRDNDQYLTFVYAIPNSARTLKGYVPYASKGLESSQARGDAAVRSSDLRDAGLPWWGEDAKTEPKADKAAEAARKSAREEDLEQQVADLEEKLASATVLTSPQEAPGAPVAPAGAVTGDGAAAQEPVPDYDDKNVSDIQEIIQEADPAQVQAIAAYERAHAARKGVLDAASKRGANPE